MRGGRRRPPYSSPFLPLPSSSRSRDTETTRSPSPGLNSVTPCVRRPVMLNSDQSPEYGDIRYAGHEGGDFIFSRIN